MVEDFGVEAIKYNSEMIVLSTQLSDWGETSANQAIALTEYFISHYNINKSKVYLHGYSGGGETGSLIMGMKPELYTAYLETSSQWDGDLEVLANAKTPVYTFIRTDAFLCQRFTVNVPFRLTERFYVSSCPKTPLQAAYRFR